MKKKLLVVFGTRPELIKLYPIIDLLKASNNGFDFFTINTNQHDMMVDELLELFHINPDIRMSTMTHNQSPIDVTYRIIRRMQSVFDVLEPDIVMVQGDTTTAFSAAYSAFHNKIPIAHVEAGLRSFDMNDPFPEEANRVMIDRLSDYLFAPTKEAMANLAREDLHGRIHMTGNTVVDSVLKVSRMREETEKEAGVDYHFDIVVTAHRRESFGEPLRNICKALRLVSESYPHLSIGFFVHPNPNVRDMIEECFGYPGVRQSFGNIHFLKPARYVDFVGYLDRCMFIMTDSGGIQEEACALGKNVIVMRNKTERPEALSAGYARLSGTNTVAAISDLAFQFIEGDVPMPPEKNPYGDGHASERIIEALSRYFL